MKNFAWVNTETEFIENVIVYDGVTEIAFPPNVLLVEIPEEGIVGAWSMAGIGWKYVNGQFVEPPLPPAPPTGVTVTNVIGDAPNVIA
jgi:hypothetical protein